MSYTFVLRNDQKSDEIKAYLENKIKLEKNDVNPDIVIAIGGDGTILKAIHKYSNATIFGVFTGHLGFYANYDSDKLEVLINDINNNEYTIDYLDSLEAEFKDNDGNICKEFALNEFTIMCPPRTINLDVFIDDEYFERFRGTGLVVSTPCGSTAYNKSLDGSVIDTSLKVMQLTEIAGINSNAYGTLSSPLVLSNERRIRLEAEDIDDIFITADNISYNVNKFNYINIHYKKNSIKMAYHEQMSFIKRINRTFIISKK